MNVLHKLVALILLSLRIHTILCQNSRVLDQLTLTILNTGMNRTTEPQDKNCGYDRKCVKRSLCNNGNIKHNGQILLDLQNDGDGACSYLEQCCHIRQVLPDKPIPGDVTEFAATSSCGHRNSKGLIYQITETHDGEAQFAEFPWMVLITYDSFRYGGSLIAPNVVLTNAYGVKGKTPQKLLVRAGEWDMNYLFEPYEHQEKEVEEIICHENFKSDSLHNGIALLILKSPFILAPNVQPICLPKANITLNTTNCLSSGWGKNKYGTDGVHQQILKKIELPIVPHATCEAQLRNTYLSSFFQLHQSFICAGGEEDKDMCTGDGGSPLVCADLNQPDRYYQVGIVAWGVECGKANIPGVYTNVLHLREWINVKLRERKMQWVFDYINAF